MTREAFDNLVQKIEDRYKNNASGLRRMVLLWAALGYGWFLAWIAVIIAIGLAFILAAFRHSGWLSLLLLLVGSFTLVFGLGGVWHGAGTRGKPPPGRRIRKSEAPALFAEISNLRKRLKTLPFHSIMVTPDFNAYVRQEPRLGMFGWWKNHLALGLPMLEMLELDEMRAVLAHEFAHLSKRHGRMGHWLYRLRLAWKQLIERIEAEMRPGEISFRRASVLFMEWFWPRFNAYAFVLSRTQEYEADKVAGELVGPEHMANALIRFSVIAESLETKFWPNLWCMASSQAAPVTGFLERLVHTVRLDRARAGENAVRAMREISTNMDTHPCLLQRVAALSWNQEWPDLYKEPQPASIDLFGQTVVKLREDINTLWCNETAKPWLERYQRASALQSRLDVIGKTKSADADIGWDQAAIKMHVEGLDAADPLFRSILEKDPYHARARFYLSVSLLSRDDPEGIPHIEYAMTIDEDCTEEACDALFRYYRRIGDIEGIRAIHRRLDAYDRNMELSAKESRKLSPGDRFTTHGITPDEVKAIVDLLKKHETIRAAYLARKKLKVYTKQPLFVLGLEFVHPWHQSKELDEELVIVEKLMAKVTLPGRFMIVNAHGPLRGIHRKVKRAPEALIYKVKPK